MTEPAGTPVTQPPATDRNEWAAGREEQTQSEWAAKGAGLIPKYKKCGPRPGSPEPGKSLNKIPFFLRNRFLSEELPKRTNKNLCAKERILCNRFPTGITGAGEKTIERNIERRVTFQ